MRATHASGPKRGKAQGTRRADQLGRQIGADATSTKSSLQSVYAGRACIGHILNRGKCGFEAYDAYDISLGIFPDQRTAANALFDRRAAS
jgi:hypothetical protein